MRSKIRKCGEFFTRGSLKNNWDYQQQGLTRGKQMPQHLPYTYIYINTHTNSGQQNIYVDGDSNGHQQCPAANPFQIQLHILVDMSWKVIHSEDLDDFFAQLVTEDESWFHYQTPEKKRQSMHWKHDRSPQPKKFQIAPSAGKQMTTVFWDMRASYGEQQ